MTGEVWDVFTQQRIEQDRVRFVLHKVPPPPFEQLSEGREGVPELVEHALRSPAELVVERGEDVSLSGLYARVIRTTDGRKKVSIRTSRSRHPR